MLVACPDSDRFDTGTGRVLDAAALRAWWREQGQPPLILVVPATRCSLLQVPVSPRQQRHLADTLPWEFEEQLPDPVESLHFAVGQVVAGEAAVVAVDREWLAALLDACADITIRRVISEYELLPWQAGCWTLRFTPRMGAEGPLLLRTGRGAGLCCSSANLREVLALLVDEQGMPQRVLLEGEARHVVALESLLSPALLARSQRREASMVVPDDAIDLLQGAFAPSLPWQQWWNRWRWAAMLLVGLWLADLGFVAAEGWQLRQSTQASRARIEERFQQALPGAVMVDPVLQLRRAAAAGSGASTDALLDLLSRMAPALAAHAGARVEQLDFNAGEGTLVLVVAGADLGEVERLRQALEAAGMRAVLTGTSSSGGRSISRMEVRA